jgi:hypothetical protein
VDDAEFFRWYGPWTQLLPSEIAQLLAGMAAPWWIVGGWAIEVFTGQSREHEDIDVAIFRGDLPIVLGHLLPNYCVWSNLGGTLRPLWTPDMKISELGSLLPLDCIFMVGGEAWAS